MFDDTKFYRSTDQRLVSLIPYSTLASWRHEKRGPAYIKLGGKIHYSGRELNRFIEQNTVQPTAA